MRGLGCFGVPSLFLGHLTKRVKSSHLPNILEYHRNYQDPHLKFWESCSGVPRRNIPKEGWGGGRGAAVPERGPGPRRRGDRILRLYFSGLLPTQHCRLF